MPYLDNIWKKEQSQLPSTAYDTVTQLNNVTLGDKTAMRGNNMGLVKCEKLKKIKKLIRNE